MEVTTIKLTKKFVKWIASLGNKGDTYEDILRRELKYNGEKNGCPPEDKNP